MAEVMCEECRDLREDHAQSKRMDEIFKDEDRKYSWKISVHNMYSDSSWEYVFDDSRGDVSTHDVAMMLKHYLASGSYSSKLVHKPKPVVFDI